MQLVLQHQQTTAHHSLQGFEQQFSSSILPCLNTSAQGTRGMKPAAIGNTWNRVQYVQVAQLQLYVMPEERRPSQKPPYEFFHPLNSRPTKKFYHIRDSDLFRPPKLIRQYPNMRCSLKYCEFYKDYNHNITML